MLESIFNSSNIYYVMGAVVMGGVVSKIVTNVSLNGLVRGASHMAKSTHSFMKLIRAKFEHACMVNDHVENIEVFIEKYIREYQVLGVRLYRWQRMEKLFAIIMGLLVLATGGFAYYYAGASEIMIQRTGIGMAMLIALLGIYQLSDEKFKLQTMKIYMIDYLENVCALRYSREHAVKEKVIIPSVQGQSLVEQAQQRENQQEEHEQKNVSQKLEEQMANIEAKKAQKKNRRESRRGRKEDYLTPEVMNAVDSASSITEMRDKYEKDSTSEIASNRSSVKEESQEQRATLSMVEKLLLEEAERREELKKQKQDDYMPNEATIREILQEFMA